MFFSSFTKIYMDEWKYFQFKDLSLFSLEMYEGNDQKLDKCSTLVFKQESFLCHSFPWFHLFFYISLKFSHHTSKIFNKTMIIHHNYHQEIPFVWLSRSNQYFQYHWFEFDELNKGKLFWKRKSLCVHNWIHQMICLITINDHIYINNGHKR